MGLGGGAPPTHGIYRGPLLHHWYGAMVGWYKREGRNLSIAGGGTVPVLLCPRQISHRSASNLNAWAMVMASTRNVSSENAGRVPGILSCLVPLLRLSRRISYHKSRHYFSKSPPTYHSALSFDCIRRYIISKAENQSIWKVKFDDGTDMLDEPLLHQTSSRFVNLSTFV